MYNEKMSYGKSLIGLALIIILVFAGYYFLTINNYFFNSNNSNCSQYVIEKYDHEKHIDAIEKILLDDWYWMMDGVTPEEYNFRKKMQHGKTIEDDVEKDMYVYTITHNGVPVAFCSYYIYSPEDKVGRILLLIVHKEHRRKNLATMLLDKAIEDLLYKKNCESIVLITRMTNIRSQGLYQKYGFTLMDESEGTVFFQMTKEEFEQKHYKKSNNKN